jgi:hypothetical protein
MECDKSSIESRLLRGGCLCGAIEYSVSDEFEYVGYCHCTDCQQFSGSFFNAFGGVSRRHFVVKRGLECISRFPKNEESSLCFCSRCGSSLFAEKRTKDVIHIRLGSLRDRQTLAPQFHAFVVDKSPWVEIRDGLPQFAQARTSNQSTATPTSDTPAAVQPQVRASGVPHL